MDLILIGDLRQLPPVRATPIYKQIKQRVIGPTLWHDLKFYELNEVMRQSNIIFSSLLTKIGNGMQLEEEELTLLESRFYSKEEVERLCPNGLRIFFSNNSVNQYNQSVLNSAENKVISVANDVYVGCHSAEQEAFVRQKLHKMYVIDTGGLPYQITFVLHKSYMITTNIDVVDGLANGAMGKLVLVDYDEGGEVKRIWLDFPSTPKVGEKMRRKVSAYMQQNNISRTAVPIARRTSSIPLNNNKTIVAKRNHFPVMPACAITIHKSQGGSFEEIVYEYDKSHTQQLMYVALSRVTSLNGLYITTINNDFRFHHGRRPATSLVSLQAEFQRLSLNRLQTIDDNLMNFITAKRGLAIFSFNCQSLRAHVADLNNPIVNNSNILPLSETCLRNDEEMLVPTFHCVVQFKRSHVKKGGVAIYNKTTNNTFIATANMDINVHQPSSLAVNTTNVGDICAARCVLENGQTIITVVVYISPNQSIKNIIDFIHEVLIVYTPEVSAVLRKDYDKMPMILSGDFNVNFASPEAQPLIRFLNEKFNLKINNDPSVPTTKAGTTIDAVFARYLEQLNSTVYISYFSHHKPIVSFLNSIENE